MVAPSITATFEDLDRAVADLHPHRGTSQAERTIPTPLPAIRSILVGVDGSECSQMAEDMALNISEATGAQVVLAHVMERVPTMARTANLGAPTRAEMEGRAEDPSYLDDALGRVTARGDTATGALLEGHPAHVLPAEAKRRDVDLVVMGSHGKGHIERFVLGSVSDAVKNKAHCSTLIVRNGEPPGRIVAAVDGSRESRTGLAWAFTLAKDLAAELIVVHVVEEAGFEGPMVEGIADHAATLESNWDIAHVDSVPVRFIARPHLDAARALPRMVEALEADLIVMGTHGLAPGRRLVLGTVAGRVAHHVPASVLIARDKPSPG